MRTHATSLVTFEEMVSKNMLQDERSIPRLQELKEVQHQKYLDFMQKYIKGESPYMTAPLRPAGFRDDVLLAPRPPTHWERERRRHTYYTRLQNGEWKSEALQQSLAQVIALAQQLFDVPMVATSIITADEWINKACTNNLDSFMRANRDMTLCGHTILRKDRHPMVVLDAKQDWRFHKFPQVVNGMVGFYAGIPLLSKAQNLRQIEDDENMDDSGSHAIGTLCIMSSLARKEFTPKDEQNLLYLADFIISIIDYHLCDTHLFEHKRRNQLKADFVTRPDTVETTQISRFADVNMLTNRACAVIESCFNGIGAIHCTFQQDVPFKLMDATEPSEGQIESMQVPVYESFGKICGYLIVSGETEEQVFDQDDENFLISFANSMTTYLQEILLVRANKAKTEFLDSMSHEIRTPVHGLTAMTDLLLENEKVTPEMVNLLTLMQSSGRAIHTVLSNIFAFRDLEAKQIERGVLEEVNLDNTLQEMLDGHAAVLKPHLELCFQNNLPMATSHVELNVEMFKSICNRLVENAIKFTDRGSITITLGSILANDRQMNVELCVRDTGIGIGSKFVKDGLFVPFCKEDSFSQGVGLGLSLCDKYAKVLDHGEVKLVETAPDEGTVFSLHFQVDRMDDTNEVGYIDDHEKWVRLQTDFKPVIYLDDERYEAHISEPQILKYKPFFELTRFPSDSETVKVPDPFAIHLIETRPTVGELTKKTNSMTEREAIRLAQRYKDRGGGCVILVTNTANMLKFAALMEKHTNLYIVSAPFGRTKTNATLYRALSDEQSKRKEIKLKELGRLQRLKELQASPAPEAFRARDIFALVVDDNIININILSTFLKKRQVRHITAQDGEEAVSLFKEQSGRINLIFMDIQMPICDGLQAVRMIRDFEKTKPEWQPSKIAMLTGLADTQSKKDSMRLGSNSWFAKPIKIKDIDVILTDWFGPTE